MKNIRKAVITSRRHSEWFASQTLQAAQKEKKNEQTKTA